MVQFADLAKPLILRDRADVALCIEVGEHVPEEFLEKFLDNIAIFATEMMIVSWAVPGQRGRGHVSCLDPDWVAAELGLRGWTVSEKTEAARQMAGKGWNKKLLVLEPDKLELEA